MSRVGPLKVGMIGWRGMVGSVLMQRMREENDFAGIEPIFFSTSNIGGAAPQRSGRRRAAEGRQESARPDGLRHPDQLPGRRLHLRSLRPAAQIRLERLLD